ncbi:MAG: hypothetical protein Q4E64_08670 [Phascolarctobacterium sp.]|uniref:hypothetical protein n=1 Tax=Phascolarctobacterium sp. TaxID=2049039 RepID=UPI0026DAFCA8|nr:hypothetical protein [Phascolarctobacterium sp.]MDO4921878.1 hypothetical protein [Phascolarctobacterium sp.]
MMRRIILFITLALLAIFLYGCSNNDAGGRNIAKPIVNVSSKSDSIDAAIYIDGTFSMAGYVNQQGSSVYSESLKNIERTITGGWKQEKIEYVKFGDSLQNLSREQFLQANHTIFYQEKDTSLQKVVEAMDANKLNIMVTDLFQTNQDIDSLIIALKKACFADESKAMAIIGVKSQFNGKIYDVGKNMLAFAYASNDEVESYRPFYLLIIGKEADVRFFAEAYAKNFDDDRLIKMNLLSKHMGCNVKLTSGKAVKNNSKERIANMAQISTMLGSNSDILQYRLKLDEKKSGFYATLTAEDVIGNCPDKFKRTISDVEKWQQTGKQKETGFLNKLMGKAANSFGNAEFVKVDHKDFLEILASDAGLHDTNANVPLQFIFNPLGIRKAEGKYRVKIAVLPDKDDYIESNNVFSDWNFQDAEISNPEDLSGMGNKTLNIDGFVKMAASLNYEMNQPGFYDIYVYLEALK